MVKMTRSAKAELTFPVGRITRYLKAANLTPRVGSTAPVFIAAVLEKFTGELLLMATKSAADENKKSIAAKHIQYAISANPELAAMLVDISVGNGGVLPTSHKKMPRRKTKKAAPEEPAE